VSPAPYVVTGFVLVALLIGSLTFVGSKLTHRTDGAPAQATARALAPPAPASAFAIPGCYNRVVPPAARPASLKLLGCAGVAVALQDMSWSSWGQQGADGSGTAVFRTCDPNCAQGRQLRDRVVVHAWNPRPPRKDSGCPVGLEVFADMLVAFPADIPPNTVQKMNTQYNGLPAVHYVNYSADGRADTQFIGFTWCS
jgi:hypothetical protein